MSHVSHGASRQLPPLPEQNLGAGLGREKPRSLQVTRRSETHTCVCRCPTHPGGLRTEATTPGIWAPVVTPSWARQAWRGPESSQGGPRAEDETGLRVWPWTRGSLPSCLTCERWALAAACPALGRQHLRELNGAFPTGPWGPGSGGWRLAADTLPRALAPRDPCRVWPDGARPLAVQPPSTSWGSLGAFPPQTHPPPNPRARHRAAFRPTAPPPGGHSAAWQSLVDEAWWPWWLMGVRVCKGRG